MTTPFRYEKEPIKTQGSEETQVSNLLSSLSKKWISILIPCGKQTIADCFAMRFKKMKECQEHIIRDLTSGSMNCVGFANQFISGFRKSQSKMKRQPFSYTMWM